MPLHIDVHLHIHDATAINADVAKKILDILNHHTLKLDAMSKTIDEISGELAALQTSVDTLQQTIIDQTAAKDKTIADLTAALDQAKADLAAGATPAQLDALFAQLETIKTDLESIFPAAPAPAPAPADGTVPA